MSLMGVVNADRAAGQQAVAEPQYRVSTLERPAL